MDLLPGEKILLQSNNDRLVLTTHRVRYSIKEAGSEKLSSIMLEELTICEITSTRKPWLLGLAALSTVMGLSLNSRNNEGLIAGVLVAVILVAAYFATQHGIIALRAAGGAIEAPTEGMRMEVATQFLDAAEAAKNNRFLLRREAIAQATQ